MSVHDVKHDVKSESSSKLGNDLAKFNYKMCNKIYLLYCLLKN
jgi:hypothetical protein